KNGSQVVFINEMASPNIKVFTTDGNVLETFGNTAKNPGITTKAIPNPYRINRDKGSYYGLKYFIESPVYTFVHHDPESNFTYRGYRAGIKDNTTYKKYKNELKSCNDVSRTPTDLAQLAEMKAKPFGLQVYNSN